MKWGQFNYFLNKIDNEGYPLSLDCFPEKSNCIKLDLIIDVYNYGKRSIAIKDFAIEVKAYKKSVCYFSPELNDYSNNQKIYSVNLPSNTINTLNMYLEIEKDETNTILFENSLSFDPENKNSLKFILHMTDIKNKKYKLKIDPLSIRTAF